MAPSRRPMSGLVLAAVFSAIGAFSGTSHWALATSQETNVVSVNVIALDGHGEPVPDLQSQDFQVFDQGKPQHITFFQQNSPKAANASPAIVLLFDLLNADFSNRGLATDQVIASLEKLESSDFLYLYLLTSAGTVYPIHPLPDNTVSTETAVPPWTAQIRPLLNTALNNLSGLRPKDDIGNDATLGALLMLTSKMAPLPGRKSLIWITRGIPTLVTLVSGAPFDYSRTFQKLGTAFDRSDVSVNSVVEGETLGTENTAALDQFADLTGGKVYREQLDKAISETMVGSRSAYEIKYAAPPADGKYHKLRVTCSRKGIRIQTKQGYYATP